jgi:hypothetical protein
LARGKLPNVRNEERENHSIVCLQRVTDLALLQAAVLRSEDSGFHLVDLHQHGQVAANTTQHAEANCLSRIIRTMSPAEQHAWRAAFGMMAILRAGR